MLLALPLAWLVRGELPAADRRTETIRDFNSPRTFGNFPSPSAWSLRAAELRAQILMSCGLAPLPGRTPLEARIFGRVDGDGYTVERVQMQPSPGVYLAGNLYRPKETSGPSPGILLHHGHWKQGRLESSETANLPAQCIELTRLGFVVFSHDMIGYQDTTQFTTRGSDNAPLNPAFHDNHVAAFRDPALQLWNLNLAGQQLWNSIRALDFLAELPDVDAERLGCAGASGGAMQSILLAAVDSRIKVSVTENGVSHFMQGECPCENAPGLRISGYNVEFAAASAPRPQLIIGNAGAWTRTTPEIEGPDIQRIYGLMSATNRFRAVTRDASHPDTWNSHRDMDDWLVRWLHGRVPPEPGDGQPPETPDPVLLRVFSDGRPPPGALNEATFITQWIQRRQDELLALQPTNRISFTNYLKTFVPHWSRVLALDGGERPPLVIEGAFGRSGRGDRIERRLLMPDRDQFTTAVVLVHPDGRASIGKGGARERFAARLIENQIPVLAFDAFQTGPLKDPTLPHFIPLTNVFTTYNRTLMQERVQDILTAIAYVRQVVRPKRVVLIGDGPAGLAALLAARAADGVIVDAGGINAGEDRTLLGAEVFVPGLKLIGGFDGAASLAAPRPFWIHHTGGQFSTVTVSNVYNAAGAADQLRIDPVPASDPGLLDWITALGNP